MHNKILEIDNFLPHEKHFGYSHRNVYGVPQRPLVSVEPTMKGVWPVVANASFILSPSYGHLSDLLPMCNHLVHLFQ